MRRRDGTFDGSEGSVHWRCWEPELTTGTALIVHGYAEHGERYAHVAGALAAHGIACYAPDHLGHGRSAGERALIVDFDHVVDDLVTLGRMAADDHPGLALVVVGHSMGGLLASRLIQRGELPVAGVALLGAVLGDWTWARDALAQGVLPEGTSDPAGMSRDPAAAASYADDPLIYHGPYKRPLLQAEVAALDASSAELHRIVVPVAVLHGTEDPFVPPQPTVDAVERTSAPWHRVHLYAGARHELVNETNRAEVVDDLVEFCVEALRHASV
jgi:alpha-beta hydrolase superfamily lysophospholipase